MEKRTFNLDDFMAQMSQIKELGLMRNVVGMIPGMSNLTTAFNLNISDVERQMSHMRAIYDSMTPEERRKPNTIEDGRRRRISTGAGVAVEEVGQFVQQFESARDMWRNIGPGADSGRIV